MSGLDIRAVGGAIGAAITGADLTEPVSDAAFAELLRQWFGNLARVLQPGRGFYVWGGYSNVTNYPPALVDAGLYLAQVLV